MEGQLRPAGARLRRAPPCDRRPPRACRLESGGRRHVSKRSRAESCAHTQTAPVPCSSALAQGLMHPGAAREQAMNECAAVPVLATSQAWCRWGALLRQRREQQPPRAGVRATARRGSSSRRGAVTSSGPCRVRGAALPHLALPRARRRDMNAQHAPATSTCPCSTTLLLLSLSAFSSSASSQRLLGRPRLSPRLSFSLRALTAPGPLAPAGCTFLSSRLCWHGCVPSSSRGISRSASSASMPRARRRSSMCWRAGSSAQR